MIGDTYPVAGQWIQGLVVGLLPSRERAEQAIRALRQAGFESEQIGVAARDRTARGELVEETGSRAAEGAAAGAVGGGVLGGAVGLLVGVGALAIPGIGPVVAGGALASALGVAGATAAAGAGIGAATGGMIGALVGLGVPEEHARYFERGVHEGGILVTVDAGPRVAAARDILNAHGADLGPLGAGAAAGAEAETAAARPGTGTWAGTGDRRAPGVPGRRRSDVRSSASLYQA
jgi:hypothetical protein